MRKTRPPSTPMRAGKGNWYVPFSKPIVYYWRIKDIEMVLLLLEVKEICYAGGRRREGLKVFYE